MMLLLSTYWPAIVASLAIGFVSGMLAFRGGWRRIK